MAFILTIFCRWPGIISPDPAYDDQGNYIIRYQDGTNDPQYYHIEFLGEPHTHAWISANKIEVFNVATADLLNHKSMKLKRSKQQYEKSMQESSKLVNLTNAERLEACVYKYVKPKCKIKGTIRLKLRHTFLLIYFQERNKFLERWI